MNTNKIVVKNFLKPRSGLYKILFLFIIVFLTVFFVSTRLHTILKSKAQTGLIGHIIDTYWNNIDREQGYTKIFTDIDVEVSPGIKSYYYYALSPYFTNGNNLYTGLQTNGYNGSVWIGKMAIFSVWNVTSGIAERDGWGTTFGGEGTGYSVRIPFNWRKNRTYRLTIYRYSNPKDSNSIWAAKITSVESGKTKRIGRIYVPDSFGQIRSPVTFHERYMGLTDSCNDLEKSKVTFRNTGSYIGKKKVLSKSWWDYYNGMDQCGNMVWKQTLKNGVRSAAGILKP